MTFMRSARLTSRAGFELHDAEDDQHQYRRRDLVIIHGRRLRHGPDPERPPHDVSAR